MATPVSKVTGIATGDVLADGTVAMTGAIATSVGTMTSSVANGASAKAFALNTPAYTTAGAKLLSVQNNSVEKAYIDKDGYLLAEKFSITSTANPFTWTEIRYGSNGWVLKSYAQDMLYVSGQKQCVLTQSSSFFGWTYSATIEGAIADTGLYRGIAGRVDVCTTAAGTYGDLKLRNEIMTGVFATSAAAPTIASAGTIAPTTTIAFVSGTTTISTITAPSPISAGGGQITLIPTGLWATNTAGNIALATTAVVSKALILTYDNTTGMWYPSY